MKVLHLKFIASMYSFMFRQHSWSCVLIVEFSRSHSDTPHAVESSGRVISPLQRSHTTFTSDRHPCTRGFRTRNPSSKSAAADSRLDRRTLVTALSMYCRLATQWQTAADNYAATAAHASGTVTSVCVYVCVCELLLPLGHNLVA